MRESGFLALSTGWLIVAGIALILIIALNLWDRRRRKRLSAEQRRREDAETDHDIFTW